MRDDSDDEKNGRRSEKRKKSRDGIRKDVYSDDGTDKGDRPYIDGGV